MLDMIIDAIQKLTRSYRNNKETKSLNEIQVDIFAAVANGDEVGVRHAAMQGQDVNAKRNDGVTPLVLACSHHVVGVVAALLELGADPDLPTNDNTVPYDHAKGDLELEWLLHAARRRRGTRSQIRNIETGPIKSGISFDLSEFLDTAELELPVGGMKYLRNHLEKSLGIEQAQDVERQLASTNFRVLYEQLFASEALGTAYLTSDCKTFRSPMSLGRYAVDLSRRKQFDLVEQSKNMYEITDELLWTLLPEELFTNRPKRICEIGGAWGATIKHFAERFSPDIYYNFEPDRHYAQWAAERFGTVTMAVDGETLRGVADDSIDLVLANNVLIFVPPIKVWSYLREMRRVIRKNGLIFFNALLSDELTEQDLDMYLNEYFPKRTIQIVPGDLIKRIFIEPSFVSMPIPTKNKYNKEYRLYKRIE